MVKGKGDEGKSRVGSDSFLLISHAVFGMAVTFRLDQRVSVTLQGHLTISADTFWLTHGAGAAPGISRVGPRRAAEHPTAFSQLRSISPACE